MNTRDMGGGRQRILPGWRVICQRCASERLAAARRIAPRARSAWSSSRALSLRASRLLPAGYPVAECQRADSETAQQSQADYLPVLLRILLASARRDARSIPTITALARMELPP